MFRGNTRPVVRLLAVTFPALALMLGLLLPSRPAFAQYGDPRRQQMEAALDQAESDVRRATADAR